MAKRKNKLNRPIGIEKNNICPKCGHKVKTAIRPVIGNVEYTIILHWFTRRICELDGVDHA